VMIYTKLDIKYLNI